MKELIEKLIDKANIDEATAEKVVEVVKGFLKDKLPEPIDSQVAKVLDGLDASDAGEVLGKLKKLF